MSCSRTPATLPRRRHRQGGIALIEALVGMLIFAFGVLGLVGLQASMTKAQTAARFRAEASNLASDLFALIESDHLTRLTLYSSANCANYVRCADWLRKAKDRLPGGDAATVIDGASGTVTVTLSWVQGGDRNQYVSSMVWQQ